MTEAKSWSIRPWRWPVAATLSPTSNTFVSARPCLDMSHQTPPSPAPWPRSPVRTGPGSRLKTMEMLEFYDLTWSYRSAAASAGVDHQTGYAGVHWFVRRTNLLIEGGCDG